MASQRRHSQSTDGRPLGSPAEWIADGHVTCNIQCSGGKCRHRMVDVRLDTLPQDLPWSTIGGGGLLCRSSDELRDLTYFLIGCAVPLVSAVRMSSAS